MIQTVTQPRLKKSLLLLNKIKRNFRFGNFTNPADNRVKIKEMEMINKYIDRAWELENVVIKEFRR